MKKLIAASLLLGMATLCGAREPLPAPPSFEAPTGPVFFQPEPTPADIPAPTAVAPGPAPVIAEYAPGTILHAAPAPISIYQRVRYVQSRNIHPCAKPMVVAVQNPDRRDACCCPCVYVEICVPPCDPTCITCNCSGNRVRYEFGDCYAVNLVSRNGVVIVNYDD
jgi:hypothetical protein